MASNVLAPTRLITKSVVKRRVAAAIGEAQDRNGWSNEDAGAALGVCGNTIINRKDVDDHGKQMTVFELLRSIPSDRRIARHILALVGCDLTHLNEPQDDTTDRAKQSTILRASLAVSVMLEDDSIDDEEIRANRKPLEEARDALDKMLRRVGPKGQTA